ncbi:GNAT family N-acetyltransferase [Aurantivibrio infirmus]
MQHKFLLNPSQENIDLILNGLIGFNQPFFPKLDNISFGCFLEDESGEIQGGATGSFILQTAHINYFWLSKNCRNKGLGTQLIAAIEQEALSRNMISITLDTYSFQAPGFYEKQGFVCSGQYRNSPVEGVNKLFYQKHLAY